MKRLFRTSKSGVDPLPSPPPAPLVQPQLQNGPPSKRSMANVLGPPGDNLHPQQPMPNHHHHDHKPRQGSVTPFPVDLGRDPPQPPQPPTHSKSVSRKTKDKSSTSTAPSLLEIQQIQAQVDRDREMRRDEWLAAQRAANAPSRPSPSPARAFENAPSPDGWTVVSNDPTPSHPSPASTATQTLYLPPGARPPSPPAQFRPATPTRPRIPSMGHSQTSLKSAGYPDMDPYVNSTPRAGRERGYSSASGSGRGSDLESSAHGHGSSLPPITSKHSQPHTIRSPLSNPFATPDPLNSMANPVSYPAHPFATAQPVMPIERSLVEEMSAIRVEGPTPEEVPKDTLAKEKKKFWGRAWPDKKEKGRMDRSPARDPRPSQEWSNGDVASMPPSSHGHGASDDESHRGKIMGLDFITLKKESNPSQVESVTTAIQLLCAHSDPAFASSYEVCDRINLSSSPESVSKEAAHALRKQFKHGNEAERRAAASLWLIMMRNVTAKGFRVCATNKKFLAALEPILLAPPAKPLVSVPTHRVLADILADLTYHFGMEKGSEALIELWRKVKMPQEPDLGTPLPADYQGFQPENFYTSNPYGSPDNTMLASQTRQASSPNPLPLAINDRSVPPPVPHRGPNPMQMGGPGYASLPNHGDDVRRLVEESTAAKESSRVLSEALVYTRPEELEQKPVIKEFYRKCFLAHESLTNQIEWAQAEAAQSRERVIMAQSMNESDDSHGATMEEQALGQLFEAHAVLAESLKQHDDLERMAMDEREMREVRERSKKETRMDRNGAFDGSGNLFVSEPGASSSRSPSPVPHSRLPLIDNPPRQGDMASPMPIPRPHPVDARSRTPSPDRLQPRIPNSPRRTASPLGQSTIPARSRAHRPLPNPFTQGMNESQQSLGSSAPRDTHTNPSRSGTGSTNDGTGSGQLAEADANDVHPVKPSRKALGKRRAVVDPDNHFDPDDMFGASNKSTSDSSEEEIMADEVYLSKPVEYAYDAYREKLDAETATTTSRQGSMASASGHGSMALRSPVQAR